MDETTIEAAIARAEELRPHYAHVTARLFPVRRPGGGGITADRYLRLYYDREAIGPWELDWAAARVLVVIEHYTRRHSLRQQGREQVTWDVATEIAVTDSLAREGIRFRPETLYPETFGLPEGLAAEEYALRLYRMCLTRRQQIHQRLREISGQDIPDFGSAGSEIPRDWELPEGADVPTIDYLIAMMRFSDEEPETSTPGHMPGSRAIDVEESRQSKVDWRVELRGLFGSLISTIPGIDDYSFQMPDPDIGLFPGIIMPGMVARRATFALVIDSSGSMGPSRLAQAISEVGAILKTQDNGGVFVYSCDAAVHTVKEVFLTQQISLIGGGGTDMGVGIKAAANHYPQPDAIVVITDGDTKWPKKGPPGIPVIVVLVGNGTGPRWAYKTFDIPITH